MQLVVAASGGADSIALMALAVESFPPAQVVAVTVDHGLRKAAKSEQQLVKSTADKLGIGHVVLSPEIAGYGHANWRQARLTALMDYCVSAGTERLWLGHHADDSVETSAIRLLASGPLNGLAGITAKSHQRGITVERPLLRFSGRTVRRLVMAKGFAWTEDPSNRSLTYKRSVVRQTLAANATGAADATALVRCAGMWRVQFENLVQRAWNLVAEPTELGSVGLHRLALDRLPASLRAHLLRRAGLAVVGHPDRLRHVEFASLAASLRPGEYGGMVIEHDGTDRWWLSRNAASIDRDEELAKFTIWDKRVRLVLKAPPPPGSWVVTAVEQRRVGAMARLAPSNSLAALPAIIGDDGRLVAIPHLGLWRGQTGPFWAANLTCEWLRPEPQPIFELAR